ncbi:hypothetical protein JQK62_23670, partial [Leptospira santarosai]|nr:hypothetical protein [Leptospira santarosai]
TVILQSILPVNNQDFPNKIPNETVDQFNEVLQKLANKHGLDYVDLNPHFKDNDGQLKEELTVDGVHLTGKDTIYGLKIYNLMTSGVDAAGFLLELKGFSDSKEENNRAGLSIIYKCRI